MKRKNIEKVVFEIERLLAESEANAVDAACGYDEGWYNGESEAYEKVLELLKKVIDC
jgi:hypothetical protein